MVKRCFITPNLLRSLSLPKGKEYWIADTSIRGFGVRVWKRAGKVEFNYTVRKSNKDGKSIRRSLNRNTLVSRAYLDDGWYWDDEVPLPHERDLASYLAEARNWAKLEIAKITGRIESDEVLNEARIKDEAYRSHVGKRVANMTLGQCVELVLSSGKSRNWTVEYQDRLRQAFDAFDLEAECRDLLITDLAGGLLAKKIEASSIGYGTMRVFRSLMNVVIANIHVLGGPSINRLWPHGITSQIIPKEEFHQFLEQLEALEFKKFLDSIRDFDCSWQSKTAIELALCFNSPFSRVLNGRWSQIVDNQWYPYGVNERKFGYLRTELINGRPFECLKIAADMARLNRTESDFWLPSDENSNRPIKNVDRTWKRVLRENDWPEVSIGFACKQINLWHPLSTAFLIGNRILLDTSNSIEVDQ